MTESGGPSENRTQAEELSTGEGGRREEAQPSIAHDDGRKGGGESTETEDESPPDSPPSRLPHSDTQEAPTGAREVVGSPGTPTPVAASASAASKDGSGALAVRSPRRPKLDRERRSHAWGVAARCVALAGLLIMAVVAFAQLTYQSDWVTGQLRDNDLSMPQRVMLIITLGAGLLTGGLGCGVLLFIARRRGWSWESVERWCWFLTPGLLLPLLPQLLRTAAWRGRHTELLMVMVCVVLIAHVVFARAAESVPPPVRRLSDWLHHKKPPWFDRYGPWTVVLSGALFYALFFSFYTIRWHCKLRTHNFDVGINDNLMYGGLKGLFMHSTVTFPEDPGKYMGAHAKLGGYLFLPIYYFYPRAETLLAIESSLLGLGAIPLFAFAKRHISVWAAVGVTIAYLCYYPMHSANFYEVNHIPMAAFFVLAMVWAADVRRWWWFVLSFLSALLMREDMPVGLAIIGAFMLLSGHRPVAGLWVAGVSSVWFLVLRFAIMDSFAEWWFPKMYKELWAPGEKGYFSVLKTLVTNPLFVVNAVFEKRQLEYLLHLFVPLAFVPVRRWYLWAAAIPGFLLTLLATDYKPVTTYSFQYVMHWGPYLFLAAPLALAALAKDGPRGPGRAKAALGAMLLSSLVLTFNYGAFPQRGNSVKGGYFTIEFDYSDEERREYADVVALRKLVPKDASVVATENVGPHFSSRLAFYSLRRGTHEAEYIVAEKDKLDLADTRKHFRHAVENGEYGVVEMRGRFALLKRGYDTAKNARLIREWRP